MIVDDDKDILAVTKAMLETKGHAVHAFSDPTLALKHIESCKDCRVVVSDIIMPGMTGVELAIYVRKARPEMKIILTSAMPIDQKDWRAILPLAANVDGFIAKPFSIQEIADIIRKYGQQTQRNGF